MHTASQALAIERQASAQPSLAERVSRPKTRAILGLMRLNFLSVKLSYWNDQWCKSYKYHCLRKIPFAYFQAPVKPEGVKIIIFHGEINPPDAINGGGGKWYRYVLPSDWIKDAWQ